MLYHDCCEINLHKLLMTLRKCEKNDDYGIESTTIRILSYVTNDFVSIDRQ